MIIIRHNNGVVTDALNCRDDATNENIKVVAPIPRVYSAGRL